MAGTSKRIIVILSVLLFLAILSLAALIVYKNLAGNQSPAAAIPNNTILLVSKNIGAANAEAVFEKGKKTALKADALSGQSVSPQDNIQRAENISAESGAEAGLVEYAAELSLYSRHSEENTRFEVSNMFPGDAETKYFRVKVSYQNSVTVKYRAVIQPGCEKLAEVLKVKVSLPENGGLIYDGLMKDMPFALECTLSSPAETTSELYYEITAYLDTSVGSEYMNKNLSADFCWWADDSGALEPSPETGDETVPVFYLCLGTVSLLSLAALLIKLRKEARNEGD